MNPAIIFPILTITFFLVLGLATKQFLTVRKYRIRSEARILTIVFFLGSISALKLPSSLIKWGIELIVFLYFITNLRLASKSRSFSLPFFKYFLSILSVIILSFIVNSSEFVASFYFVRFFLSPFLFFWGLYNSKLKEIQLIKLSKYLFFLFAFQIVAQFLKFIVYGYRFLENPVGSITLAGGGVASYIPLIALGFLFAYYNIIKRTNKIWLWIILFSFIGIASQKRLAFYFLPFIFIIAYYLTNRVVNKKYKTKQLRLILIMTSLSIGLIFISVKLNYTTRIDRNEVSIATLYEHADNYLNKKNSDDLALGRIAAFFQTVEIVKEANWENMLLGYGPSVIKGFSRGDGKMEQFGFGGTFPGWTYQFLQIGLLGCFFYILLYTLIFYKVKRKLKNEKSVFWRFIGVGTMIYIILVFFDFTIYGITLFNQYALTYSLMFFIASLLKKKLLISNK